MENKPMKPNYKLAVAVLAGTLIGAAGGAAIHAEQVQVPPAYVIAEVQVTDPNPNAMMEYADKAPGMIAAYGGRYVVRGGKAEVLEGEAPNGLIVVIAFDSREKALRWYDSPEYKAIRPIRQRATKSRLILAEGVAPQ
jgi:uncharacterized protein (DUF1330 family)